MKNNSFENTGHQKRAIAINGLWAALFFFIATMNLSGQPVFIQDSLDAYIQRGMRQWKVPGLALVIIKDGQIVKQQGYGVADIVTKKPVNTKTLFFIASNTKLFTGTALSKLAYEKKLSLNDKIIKFYPWYKLYDETMTREVTLKDMLTHRIGTKTFQGDFTFWNSKLSREEVMKKMKLLKPDQVFRDAYGYCNSCFLTAGMAIPKVTGKSWETYITDEILTPLKMKASFASSNHVDKKLAAMATPYTTSFTDTLKEVPYDRWDNLGPAASIVSNVEDLSHWLTFQLDSGRYDGQQLMPWKVIQATRDVQISTGSRKSSLFPTHFTGYGLGIFTSDYNGRQIFWHTGGAAGMLSNVCFVPEENLGMAILSNNDNQNFFESLRYQILDAYLGVPYVNRSKQLFENFRDEMDKQLAEIKSYCERVRFNKDHKLNLKSYCGSYSNKLYGDLTITQNGKHLEIIFHSHQNLRAALSYMGNEEWLISYHNIEYGLFPIRFKLEKGKPKSISIKVNEYVEYDPYEFEKN
ncbi:MAG: serine hydrolase [Saprospiraceae bacterium]|nr:serine hydrolase [Saprospiraceae bacterium]